MNSVEQKTQTQNKVNQNEKMKREEKSEIRDDKEIEKVQILKEEEKIQIVEKENKKVRRKFHSYTVRPTNFCMFREGIYLGS
jgi:hypothetical protein